MLNLISKKIVSILLKNKIINTELTDIYIYGFTLLISNLIGFSTVLLISGLFSSILKGFCFLIILITLRIHTGGYHSKNFLSCNLILNFSFLICFFISKTLPKSKLMIVHTEILIMLITIAIIIKFIPIENKNKPILKNKRIYKIKSIILYLIFFIIGFYFYYRDFNLGYFILTVLDFTIFIIILELIRRRFFYG